MHADTEIRCYILSGTVAEAALSKKMLTLKGKKDNW
jgi:hypothetical protein